MFITTNMTNQTVDTKQKLAPIGQWFSESFAYVLENWKMLFKVYLWSMLIYMGIMLLMGLVIGVVAWSVVKMGISWNILTIPLAGIAGVAAFLLMFALAGKTIMMQIYSIQAPITNIREKWNQIKLKEGLSLYWVFFLAIFAFYGGFFLLFIPGIIIGVWISLVLFTKLNDGASGLRALILSRDYVRGYFWPILGRLLLYGIVMIFLMFASYSIYNKMMEMGAILGGIGYIFYMIFTFILSTIAYRLCYGLYLKLVEIKGKLEVKASKFRLVKWGLLVTWPIVAIILIAALSSINPAAQIEKAQRNVELLEQNEIQ